MKMKSEEENDRSLPTICERRIWKFYEWAVIVAPVLIMLSHWYIFYVFSRNNHELMHYSEANEACIAWIYSVLFLYIPIMILPATYFFKWCNLWRIPFVYFIFINIERWYYGSWFCTNEMVDTHYILIYCIIGIYIMEIGEIVLSNLSNILSFGKNCIAFVYAWAKSKVHRKEEEK